jgi:hypothetical protein
VREQVAKALFNKGVRLGALDRSKDAIDVYDDLVARFCDDPSGALPSIVQMARVRRALRDPKAGTTADHDRAASGSPAQHKR